MKNIKEKTPVGTPSLLKRIRSDWDIVRNIKCIPSARSNSAIAMYVT